MSGWKHNMQYLMILRLKSISQHKYFDLSWLKKLIGDVDRNFIYLWQSLKKEAADRKTILGVGVTCFCSYIFII